MRLRVDAVTSRTPVVWAWTVTAMAIRPAPTPARTDTRMGLLLTSGGETIERGREADVADRRSDAYVVDWRIRVEPVRPRIHVQRGHLGQVLPFQEQLLAWNQRRQEIQLRVIELEQLAILRRVECRVRE